jgi:tRNA-specific 2-thiouridylase
LIVGTQKDLLSAECRVSDINWIGKAPVAPMHVYTRLRYRSQEVASTLKPLGNLRAIVQFEVPQPAVTPGQGAVFYRGDEILGGGWIAESAARSA